jgi:hypothetical protein
MSDPKTRRDEEKESSGEDSSQGPSLTLLYSLIALALVVATALAAMIVWPFYKGR